MTVQLPVPHVGGFSGKVISQDMIESHYRAEGEKALAPSVRVLQEAKVAYTPTSSSARSRARSSRRPRSAAAS